CGDGIYRSFRLDAFIQRDKDGMPVKMTGTETLALGAWLSLADEGDRITCEDSNGRVRVLEAVSIQGVMTLRDISEIEDMQRENETLRREIQRRIFMGTHTDMNIPDERGTEGILRGDIEEIINLALNVLPGNNQLKALRRSINEPNFMIGIAGLTSSGKSTFMNALLGEKLIPEQTRATTNIPVICREGETRYARVFYQDGRHEDIRGNKLDTSYMKSIASENYSSGNRVRKSNGLSRIEITIPGAMIPEGFCFADTPGADALAGSGGSALRNILPEFDMIFYVTPLRSRLKGSDYDFLKNILALNKRIVFILTQTDLERDDSEAGKVIHSTHEKIMSDIHALREDMKKFSGLDVDVIPISARNALENFYSRNNSHWHNSNIECIANYLAPLMHNTFSHALTLRAERTLRVIESSLSQGNITGSSRWRLGDIAGKLRLILRDCEVMPDLSHAYSFSETIKHNPELKYNLLGSLMASMREREFRNKFFALKALNGKRKIILLSAERNNSMKLFARLSHNLMLESLPDGDASSHDWLYSGHAMPFGCINLPVMNSGDDILIAPSDSRLRNNIDWHKLFREYAPVVSVDLARVDSGLSDLSHSPYITGLALSDWVLAFGNAGMFDTRQTDLVAQVPGRVKEFIDINGLKSPEWFIFENYKIFQ
ncbi:MAG: dynamin family protein, partial [Synergistaceae bacterium]|nr:dynamin family protein [Synergistaceae bacterium]